MRITRGRALQVVGASTLVASYPTVTLAQTPALV